MGSGDLQVGMPIHSIIGNARVKTADKMFNNRLVTGFFRFGVYQLENGKLVFFKDYFFIKL